MLANEEYVWEWVEDDVVSGRRWCERGPFFIDKYNRTWNIRQVRRMTQRDLDELEMMRI